MRDGFGEVREARSLEEVGDERVEQTGARAEDEVDRRARDLGSSRDVVDAHGFGRRLPQAFLERVEDASPCFVGPLGAEVLLVLPGHRAMLPISLDTLSFKVQRVFPMNRFDTDVLIVGGGPAGLAAAATLGHYGVSTLVAERRSAPSPIPRATVISTRSMEILRSWQLEDEVRAGGIEGDVQIWECETLARAAEGCAYAVGYPSREQAAVVSPTAPGIVPQDWLEIVLRRHIETLPSVRLELGTEALSLDNRLDGVSVQLRDRTAATRWVRARVRDRCRRRPQRGALAARHRPQGDGR